MKWSYVDKKHVTDFGLWTQQRWSDDKIMKQHKITEVEYTNTSNMVKQDGYT